jgi:hypothetical protein
VSIGWISKVLPYVKYCLLSIIIGGNFYFVSLWMCNVPDFIVNGSDLMHKMEYILKSLNNEKMMIRHIHTKDYRVRKMIGLYFPALYDSSINYEYFDHGDILVCKTGSVVPVKEDFVWLKIGTGRRKHIGYDIFYAFKDDLVRRMNFRSEDGYVEEEKGGRKFIIKWPVYNEMEFQNYKYFTIDGYFGVKKRNVKSVYLVLNSNSGSNVFKQRLKYSKKADKYNISDYIIAKSFLAFDYLQIEVSFWKPAEVTFKEINVMFYPSKISSLHKYSYCLLGVEFGACKEKLCRVSSRLHSLLK